LGRERYGKEEPDMELSYLGAEVVAQEDKEVVGRSHAFPINVCLFFSTILW
jgi:hypothetical protein